MNEASRLLREAIQESATDPATGKIDMDLINTGTGSHGRHMKHDLMRELKNKLLSYESSNISWTTLFNDFNGQSTVVCIHKLVVLEWKANILTLFFTILVTTIR